MSVWRSPSSVAEVILGTRVDRAAATIPDTTTADLFTVTGGRVLIRALYGEVTTVMSATVTSINLQYKKTGGSDVDISAATVVTSDAVGTLYTITGVAADLLSAQTVAGTEVPTVTFASVFAGAAAGIIVPAGAVRLQSTATQTGAAKWSLWYIALDDGAAVAAA